MGCCLSTVLNIKVVADILHKLTVVYTGMTTPKVNHVLCSGNSSSILDQSRGSRMIYPLVNFTLYRFSETTIEAQAFTESLFIRARYSIAFANMDAPQMGSCSRLQQDPE